MIKTITNLINKKKINQLNDILNTHPKYVNIQNNYGVTALILSIKANNFEIFKNIISKKPNLYLSTKIIYNPVHKTKYNKINHGENNAMWWACKLNKSAFAKELLENGFDLNCFEKEISPLAFAIKYNNINLFKLLLQNNIDYNYLYFDKRTYDYTFILKEAIKYNNPMMVEELLKYKDIMVRHEKCRVSIEQMCEIRKDIKLLEEIKSR